MTHSEREALAAAFGGQEIDLYGAHELRQQLMENPEASSPEVAPPDVLGGLATQVAAEVSGTTWDKAVQGHEATQAFFSDVMPQLHLMPDLAEFVRAGVDFAKLQTGFEGYERAGMKPELVFAPINLELDIWRNGFVNLRQWQNHQHPDAPPTHRLQQQAGGDGLYVWDAVASNWGSLNDQVVNQTPGATVRSTDGSLWKVLVIPTATREDGGLVVDTSHNLSATGFRLTDQQKLAMPNEPVSSHNAHLPLGVYLTLQANRIYQNEPAIDQNTWTWASGTFDSGMWAPSVCWDRNFGQVHVGSDGVGYSDGTLGVRLPVWG